MTLDSLTVPLGMSLEASMIASSFLIDWPVGAWLIFRAVPLHGCTVYIPSSTVSAPRFAPPAEGAARVCPVAIYARARPRAPSRDANAHRAEMLPAGLWEQVQVSLALTVASELAASFSGATDYTTLVKLVAVVSVLAEALDSVVSRDGSIYRDTADVFRGLTVLVFVRITMNALKRGQPAGARSVVQDFGLAAREGGGEIGVLSRMTLTAWPVIESFALSCIALLCITLVARLTGRAGGPSKVRRAWKTPPWVCGPGR